MGSDPLAGSAVSTINASNTLSLPHPVFSIVLQASIALCLSIRRWVIGTGGRGGTQLKVRTLFQVADVDTGVINWINTRLVTQIV